MKTQHTTGHWNEQSFGPWVYDDELAAVLTEDMTGTVARLLPPPSEMPDGAVDTELLRAVGTLIADAPELLDTLSECLGQLEQLHYLYEGEFSERIEAADEAAKRAWKLIAKLTEQ